MKKKILNILAVSTILTTIGFIMDGDVKEPSMLMRFVEFFGMISILFILVSLLYFATTFIQKSIKGLRG